jgi:hypothetical protein
MCSGYRFRVDPRVYAIDVPLCKLPRGINPFAAACTNKSYDLRRLNGVVVRCGLAAPLQIVIVLLRERGES